MNIIVTAITVKDASPHSTAAATNPLDIALRFTWAIYEGGE